MTLLALASAGLVTGCGGSDTPASAATGRGADSAPTSSASHAGADRPDGSPSGSTASRPAAPTRVSVPSLGISSELMPLGLNEDGTVEVPPAERGMTAGWYTGRPVPGAPGPAVIIGHNATRHGPAVFKDLKDIRKGARITVRNAAGANTHFRVTDTETVSKKEFPTRKVYGSTAERALRLVTCDGAFDAEGHPVDNLIVYAVRS
ncbi:class F sortase [Streptomyces sp. NPDC058171]